MELLALWVKQNNKIKAFGLAEILVGLAITGGILITIMSVAMSTYRQVKDNEMGDVANNVMVMGVEYFKTPVSDISKEPAKTLNAITVGQFKVFKVLSSVDDDPKNFQLKEVTNVVSGTETNDLTDCSATSDYAVKFKNATDKFVLCNKITVTRTASGYNIFSTVIYKTIRGDLRTSHIIGIRQRI
jgi:hypothetical protein